jgi:hypothetical protein
MGNLPVVTKFVTLVSPGDVICRFLGLSEALESIIMKFVGGIAPLKGSNQLSLAI